MIAIQNTLVSEELLDKKFVCDLAACKGACCVQGESGAPLEAEETGILAEIWDEVKPFIPAEGVAAIESQGTHIIDSDGDKVTPLVKGKHCAYTFFGKDGTASCGIEKAFLDGRIKFRKPVSCHLYPVRLKEGSPFTKVEMHTWEICSPACACGEKLDVPVFRFLEKPLVRRFGQAWYDELTVFSGERIRQGSENAGKTRVSKGSKKGDR